MTDKEIIFKFIYVDFIITKIRRCVTVWS